MTTVAFPSEDFPAEPAITMQIPEDWKPLQSPGALMAARRVEERGAFVPNVVVRVERRPPDFEVADALTELRAFVSARPQGAISEPFKTEIDGVMFVGCDLSWVDEQVGTVLQAHLFGRVLVGGGSPGPLVQLVQVTGSIGGAQAREDYPIVKAIMKSLTVEAPEREAGEPSTATTCRDHPSDPVGLAESRGPTARTREDS